MFGILGGMLRTLDHLVRPRIVTRKYPYEKRELPERSRGLIALLREPETSLLKCEACLLCEKACPPRAISISYGFRNGFRKRPAIAPRASYYRIRMVASAPYGTRRPLSTAVTTVDPDGAPPLDLAAVERIIADGAHGAEGLTRALWATHAAYGYLPWAAAARLAEAYDVTLTRVYTLGSRLANFRGAPVGAGSAVPRGTRRYTGNTGIAGLWPAVSPAPSHDTLHEDEAHHVMEPAFAD